MRVIVTYISVGFYVLLVQQRWAMREASVSGTSIKYRFLRFSFINQSNANEGMTAASLLIMTIEQIRDIVEKMGSQFDSHEFILSFIQHYPRSYGELLVKHNCVASAHGEISNYLRQHAEELNLEQLNNHDSRDIFFNITSNAQWRKL